MNVPGDVSRTFSPDVSFHHVTWCVHEVTPMLSPGDIDEVGGPRRGVAASSRP